MISAHRSCLSYLILITFVITTYFNILNIQSSLRSTVNNDKFHSVDDFNEEILHENINHGGRHKIHKLAKSRLLPSSSSNKIEYITKESLTQLGVKAFNSLHSWHKIHTLQIYSKVPREIGSINYIGKDGTAYAFDGYDYNPPDIRSWETDKSKWERKGRFPSAQERIKFYMGKWYDTKNTNLFRNKNDWDKLPCNFMNETSKLKQHLLCFPNDKSSSYLFHPRRLFFFSTQKKLKPTSIYIEDLVDLSILHRNSSVPIVVHIGDGASLQYEALDESYPVFNKVRVIASSLKNNDMEKEIKTKNDPLEFKYRNRHTNIIWPLNRKRHLAPASDVPLFDREWEKKISKLVWRGRIPKNFEKVLSSTTSIEYGSWKQRISLVENHANSTLIDAKFVGMRRMTPKSLYGKKLSMKSMLKYKYQLSIEGNDVASGLKWMLFSDSLVFMIKPTFTSWSMEELLQPFVHYVPVKPDLSNVEEMVQWANDNPNKAKQIAQRGTLFMYDLLFHPDSYKDEEEIFKGIMKRYEENFASTKSMNVLNK